MSKKRRKNTHHHNLFLLLFLIAIMSTFCALPLVGVAAAPPDEYEGSPYYDDLSTTTLNILSPSISQDHSIHAQSDIDWGICIQTEVGGPFPYNLHFSELAIPSGSSLVVDLYLNGPENPPTSTDYILSWETSKDVGWLGTGIQLIYFSVDAIGSVDPATSYTVTFTKPLGANNGVATALSASSMSVEWETVGVDPSAQGFNVLQSATGVPGSFSQVNPSLVPPPGTPGPCPGDGCVEYIDTGLSPMTPYFYQIELRDSGGSPSTWIGTFYGVTIEESATPTPTATATPVYCAAFEGTTENWTYTTVSPMSLHTDHWANAQSQTDSTAIGLQDPNDTTNYFAMWDGWQGVGSPLVDWAAGTVFVAYFQVSGTATTNLPSMRMRFFTNHNKFNSYVRIYPTDWIVVPNHGSSSLEVPVVNHPTSVLTGENGFAMAFDVVDFADPRGGHIGTAWLDEVCVYAYDETEVNSGFAGVRTYTATQLGSQWSQMTSAAPGYSLPSFSSDTGGLHMTTTQANSRHFGAWTVDAAEQASFTNGDLHRIVYNVQASSTTAPQMRLRTHSQDYYFASYVEIVPGAGDGQAMPTGAKDIPVYFWPPGTVSGTPEIVMAFDGIDIELTPFLGGTIDLHSVDVEKMSGDLPH